MWFIGVEVEQETSAPPPKKNPGSASVPDLSNLAGVTCFFTLLHRSHLFTKLEQEFRNKNSSLDFKLILQKKKNLGDVARLKQAGFLSCDCFFMVWFGAGAKSTPVLLPREPRMSGYLCFWQSNQLQC